MYAFFIYSIYMKKHIHKQYTIRNIPQRVDRILRQRVRESGKSFNQIALEALISGVGEGLRPVRDLTEIIGSMTEQEAEKIEEEIRIQRAIDPELWK